MLYQARLIDDGFPPAISATISLHIMPGDILMLLFLTPPRMSPPRSKCMRAFAMISRALRYARCRLPSATSLATRLASDAIRLPVTDSRRWSP